MKEQEVADKVRKVLQADKVIHDQQLGVKWNPPSEEVFASPWAPGASGADAANHDDGALARPRPLARPRLLARSFS